jgi:hypothetical protein
VALQVVIAAEALRALITLEGAIERHRGTTVIHVIRTLGVLLWNPWKDPHLTSMLGHGSEIVTGHGGEGRLRSLVRIVVVVSERRGRHACGSTLAISSRASSARCLPSHKSCWGLLAGGRLRRKGRIRSLRAGRSSHGKAIPTCSPVLVEGIEVQPAVRVGCRVSRRSLLGNKRCRRRLQTGGLRRQMGWQRRMMSGVNRWLVGSSFRLAVRRPSERIIGKAQWRLRSSMAQMAEGVLSVILNMVVRIGMHGRSGGVDRTTILGRRARPRA